MLILLIGPKGSGKSHIGRILESSLGVHFMHVEPLWMAYNAACKAAGRQPTIAEGIAHVHPTIKRALATHAHVSVETTGASPEILDDLLALGQTAGLFLVRIQVPLETCLRRITTRDQTHQIPVDIETIKEAHRRSTELALPFDLVIENTGLDETQIVEAFSKALAGHPAVRDPRTP